MSVVPLRERLLLVADRWCEETGRSRGRLSTILFSGGRKLDAIFDGADLTTISYEKAMDWLSANWPEGAVWPPAVPRPAAAPRGGSPAPEGPPLPETSGAGLGPPDIRSSAAGHRS